MSQKPITLSIFFPAFNEEENISTAVQKAVAITQSSTYIEDYEILIVNDGSNDNTLSIARSLSEQNPKVKVVNHVKNQGYGAALKSGIAEAKMDYIFFTDADLQFDISEIDRLLQYIHQFPVVIGYRAPRRDPFMRLLNAKGWNMLNRVFFGLRVKDIDCAFKIFRRDLVQNLTLQSRGAMISAETLIRLSRQGVAIKEVAVTHLPRVAGSPTGAKISVIIRAFKEMMTLYWGELGTIGNKEMVKFFVVGIINTILDIAVYILLTRETNLFAEHLIAAKFISFIAGTVSSLLLNRFWTFGLYTQLTVKEITRFYTTISLSILINIAVMNALIKFGMSDWLALLPTTALTFVFNILLAHVWVFKTRYASTEAVSQS